MAKKPKQPTLHYIVEELRPLAEPLDTLALNERNTVQHDDASVAAIAASLQRYCCRQPIVVHKKSRVVLAGNGRLLAARKLGWTHLPVIFVADDPASASGYAIADNRTAEFALWDQAQLAAQLAELRDAGTFDALADALLLDELIDVDDAAGGDEDAAGNAPAVYKVLVVCADELAQQKLLRRLTRAGYECSALES